MADSAAADEREDGEARRRWAASELDRLHRQFGPSILGYLKRVTLGLLPPAALFDAYQNTLVALLERVQQLDYDPKEPGRLICAVARHKGIDALRQRRHPVHGAGALPDDQLAADLSSRLDALERAELRGVFAELFGQLPPRQALVARLFLLHADDFGPRDTYQRLTEIVEAVTGQPQSVTAVKSAWHAARAALAVELRRRGYGPEEDDP